ncbi:MAG TPA: DUF3783 domain-containing protein [Fervidobacterium sp.]|nr:DUF3783 domain-containing protein [Fervidobacterium sp.]HQG01853.1 DUF3783 domain-containing protein [Fervidobacterium sp.]HQI09594.1 DUF3783 domain-containing protein [Fervidobacterium sp.]HQI94132.1 DUF3783 domain-containing protein [Fervidobacterium sp.]HQO05972.1 DUF3783 domain-containing protein [Fervidobacterium sp.]
MENMEERVLIMHNFEKGEISKLLKVIREAFPDKEFIFASTTPTNLEWRVQDLIGELKKEHEEFKKMKEQSQENK